MNVKNENQKNILIGSALGFILILFNTFVTLPILYFPSILSFVIDLYFGLFSIFISTGGKSLKFFKNLRFIVICPVSFFIFEVVKSYIPSVIGFTIQLPFGFLLYTVLECIVTFFFNTALIIILSKTAVREIQIFNRKFFKVLLVGFVLLFAFRLIFVYLSLNMNMAMLTPNRTVTFFEGLFAALIPLCVGFSIYKNGSVKLE